MGGLAKSPLAGLAALGLGGLGPANTGGLNPAGKLFKNDVIKINIWAFHSYDQREETLSGLDNVIQSDEISLEVWERPILSGVKVLVSETKKFRYSQLS